MTHAAQPAILSIMNSTPTPEQLAKLPVWARTHIEDLAREREVALNALNKYVDEQTDSPFYVESLECTGEKAGPSLKRRYIQTARMTVKFKGVELNIMLRDRDGIELQWGDASHTGHVAFVPSSFQSALLIPHDMMRV